MISCLFHCYHNYCTMSKLRLFEVFKKYLMKNYLIFLSKGMLSSLMSLSIALQCSSPSGILSSASSSMVSSTSISMRVSSPTKQESVTSYRARPAISFGSHSNDNSHFSSKVLSFFFPPFQLQHLSSRLPLLQMTHNCHCMIYILLLPRARMDQHGKIF